jgi:hypothetical protein
MKEGKHKPEMKNRVKISKSQKIAAMKLASTDPQFLEDIQKITREFESVDYIDTVKSIEE